MLSLASLLAAAALAVASATDSPAKKSCTCGRYFVPDVGKQFKCNLCHRLRRDAVIEGIGGKKLVAVAPGSVLRYLLPCEQYLPSRCLVSGCTRQEFVAERDARRLEQPFGRHVARLERERRRWSSGSSGVPWKETMDLGYDGAITGGVLHTVTQVLVMGKRTSVAFKAAIRGGGRLELKKTARGDLVAVTHWPGSGA